MSAHVIVLGNEKGGSGKSTTALHLAIYLIYRGYRVATIDVDSRQQTLTNYIVNRRKWAQSSGVAVPHATHYHLPLARGDSVVANHQLEFDLFRQAIVEIEGHTDFVVIDTPGFDTNLNRLAHSLADTLITPLNDSLIDIDVLAHIDPLTGETRELAHYARLVQRARKERMTIDGRTIDWILMRNRISMLASRNMRLVNTAMDQLSTRLGCRVADGIAERVVFRSLFPLGLTVFDNVGDDLGGGVPPGSYQSARQEYGQLVSALNLPLPRPGDGRQLHQAGAARHAELVQLSA